MNPRFDLLMGFLLLPCSLFAGLERGWLESSSEEEVFVQISGSVVKIVDDGSWVNKGDVICRQDPSKVLDNIENLENRIAEIEQDLASELEHLKLKTRELKEEKSKFQAEHDLAHLDFTEQKNAPLPHDRRLAEIAVELAEIDVEEARDDWTRQKNLVGKGFSSPNSLEGAEILFKSREQTLQQQKARLDELLKGTQAEELLVTQARVEKWAGVLERKAREDRNKLRQIELDIEAYRVDLKSQREQLAFEKDQLNHSEVIAPKSGLVIIYLRWDWSRGGEFRPIKIGQQLYPLEKVAKIVDPSQVRVHVPIHEFDVNRFKLGQTCSVRFPALPGVSSSGEVVEVSSIARDLQNILPQGYLSESHGRPYYLLVLQLNENHSEFKPGMTAIADFEELNAAGGKEP